MEVWHQEAQRVCKETIYQGRPKRSGRSMNMLPSRRAILVSRRLLDCLLAAGACTLLPLATASSEELITKAVPSQAVSTATPVDSPFENLRIKGLSIGLPTPADTVDPDPSGIRSELAKYGIGYVGMSLNNFAQNVYPGAEKTTNGQQVYNGQQQTTSTQDFFAVTYDLGRYGIPDGQIVAGGIYTGINWDPGGPNRLGLATLTYYQTLLDKKLEIKFGYIANSLEFVGAQVGGSFATSVFGPSGSIQTQGGLSNLNTPAPGVILKYNIGDGFYNKALIQRSINPDGALVEVAANPTGFDWNTPNAGTLYMDEFGYRKAAAPGVNQTWVRVGAAYNTSLFNNLEKPGTRSGYNTFYYGLADRQLWQKDPANGAYKGIYAGFSILYAPPELNEFSQYYEARLYGIGLFNGRPNDVMSLLATDTIFSNFAVANATKAGALTHDDSRALTVSYSARFSPGLYAGLGLGYVVHPSGIIYTPRTGQALNVLANLNIFW